MRGDSPPIRGAEAQLQTFFVHYFLCPLMTSLLETQRLIIRRWIPEIDAKQVFQIYGDAEVMRFIGTGKTEASI